ncbi:MAG: hypothetical protein WC477_03410 [Patescibacteria group bacterium]
MKKEVYLELPIPGAGKRTRFVQIDPQRYDIESATRLFHREQGKGRSIDPRYVESGARFSFCQETFSVSDLERLIDSERAAIIGSFPAECNSALACTQHLNECFGMLKLFALALKDHDHMVAEQSLRETLCHMNGLCACLLSELAHSRQESQIFAERVSHVENATNVVVQDYYIEWSAGIESLLEACRSYTENFRLIEDLEKRSADTLCPHMHEMTAEDGIVARTLAFLDPIALDETSGNGFISRTLLYEMNQKSSVLLPEDIERAKEMINACKILQSDMEKAHEQLQREYLLLCSESAQKPTPRSIADAACTSMRDAQNILRVFFDKDASQQLDPSHPLHVLISAEAYKEARSYMPPKDSSPHDWYSGSCRQRLHRSVQRISSTLSMSTQLPENVRIAINTAKDQIAKFEHVKSEPCKSSIRAQRIKDSESSQHEILEASAPDIVINGNRFTELFEQLICVAYICTYLDDHPNGAKTLKSMLRVLIELQRCSEEEMNAYEPTMRMMIAQNSEFVRDNQSVSERQQKSNKSWIHIHSVKTWRRRLTKRGANGAEDMMKKHGLEQEEILAARHRASKKWASQVFSREE